MNRSRRLGGLLVVVILTVSTRGGLAFVDGYPNFRWPDGPIRLNMPSGEWGTPSSGKYQAVREGIRSWDSTSVPGTKLNFPDPEQVNVQPMAIGDAHISLMYEPLAEGSLGETERWVSTTTNQYADAELTINSNVTWSLDAGGASPLPVQDLTSPPDGILDYAIHNLEGVVRHEMGHLIGLTGPPGANHEEYVLSLMNPAYSFGAGQDRWMHADDRNGARALYPAPGVHQLGFWENDIQIVGWKYVGGWPDRAVPVDPPQRSTFPYDGKVPIGGGLRVQFTVENLGTVLLAAESVGVYLSTDQNINIGDRFVGYVPVPNVSAASGSHGSTPVLQVKDADVMVPCGTLRGTYYVGGILDPNNSTAERNETNNDVLLPFERAPATIEIVSGAPEAPIEISASSGTNAFCNEIHVNWTSSVFGEPLRESLREAGQR